MNVGIDGIVPVHLKNSSCPAACGRVDANHVVQALAYRTLAEVQMRSSRAIRPRHLCRTTRPETRIQGGAASVASPDDREVEVARASDGQPKPRSSRPMRAGCGVRAQCDQALL